MSPEYGDGWRWVFLVKRTPTGTPNGTALTLLHRNNEAAHDLLAFWCERRIGTLFGAVSGVVVAGCGIAASMAA